MLKLLHSEKIALGLALGILTSLTVKVQTIAAAADLSAADSAFAIRSPDWLNSLEPQLLAQQQQPRTALIIANYDYESDDNLVGPRQDAVDMYEKLQSLGFDVPPPLTNATKQQMEQAIRDFVQNMAAQGPGGANVFYYSGHGVQINGVNYLLPVGLAEASSEIDVEYNAVRLDYVANQMYSVVHDFNFLIIDACRNNPFLRRWNRPKGQGGQGLAFIAPPAGTMIAYAAAPGEVARDGNDNSPFTASVLNYLGRSGISIYEMLHRIREEVFVNTDQDQRPAWEGSPNTWDFSLTNSLASIRKLQLSPQPTSGLEANTPPTTTSPQAPTAKPRLVSSVTRVDYQPLQDALAVGDFRLANITTFNLMLRAADRESQGWFRREDVRNFTCEDLEIIDRLWLNYSDDKFGFSIQQEIYQSLGGTSEYDPSIWNSFANRVGWENDNGWWFPVEFSESAAAGHLPTMRQFGAREVLLLPSCVGL